MSALFEEVKHILDENTSKSCIRKTLFENQRLMQHSTISSSYEGRFWWYGKFGVYSSKKRVRQNKQQPVKFFALKSSNRF